MPGALGAQDAKRSCRRLETGPLARYRSIALRRREVALRCLSESAPPRPSEDKGVVRSSDRQRVRLSESDHVPRQYWSQDRGPLDGQRQPHMDRRRRGLSLAPCFGARGRSELVQGQVTVRAAARACAAICSAPGNPARERVRNAPAIPSNRAPTQACGRLRGDRPAVGPC